MSKTAIELITSVQCAGAGSHAVAQSAPAVCAFT
jgi:hypothetical protein